MTIWKIQPNKKNKFSISHKFENKRPVLLSNKESSIHQALIQIAMNIEEGDIVYTPEGPCLVQGTSMSGIGNN
jgi:hypothetical protein